MCFVWIWEQTAIFSLYSINWLSFITERKCVYCAVRAGYLNIIQVQIKIYVLPTQCIYVFCVDLRTNSDYFTIQHQLTVLGAPPKLRKATICFVMSICPSVRPYAWNNSAPTGQIFMKFDIWVFSENLSTKLKFKWNLTRITDTFMKTCASLWQYLAESF